MKICRLSSRRLRHQKHEMQISRIVGIPGVFALPAKCRFRLRHQSQLVKLLRLLLAAHGKIDAGRFDIAVSQHIGQAGNVLAGLVKGRGEQVPEVMREHLARRYPRRLTQPFQFIPDLPPCNTFSAFGAKDRAGSDFLFFRVFAQLAAQLGRQ